MNIKCKNLKEEKPKKHMKIYLCKLKEKVYYKKKEVCKDCPIQIKIEFK